MRLCKGWCLQWVRDRSYTSDELPQRRKTWDFIDWDYGGQCAWLSEPAKICTVHIYLEGIALWSLFVKMPDSRIAGLACTWRVDSSSSLQCIMRRV